MLNMKTLKFKNTRDVLWLNKSYREWKGVKEDKITKILIPDESSSDSVSSKSENDDNTEQKEKSSTASKVSSSSNNESNNSSDSSPVVNCTCVKLTQQPVDDLTKGLDNMCITENAA